MTRPMFKTRNVAVTDDQSTDTAKLNMLNLAFLGNWIPRFIKIPLEIFWLNAFWKATHGSTSNMPYSKVGLTSGLMYVVMAISALSIGPLSSRFGRRPCILTCLIGLSVAITGQALATSYYVILIFKGLQGAFIATMGLYQSYIVDICTAADILKHSSRLVFLLGCVGCFVPPIAALMTSLFDKLLRNQSIINISYDESLQYRCSLIVAAFIALGTFVFCYFKLEESHAINITEITSAKDKAKASRKLDALYEALLPKEYKTKPFKARLKEYLILLLVINLLLELICCCHHILYPMLHSGAERGLQWTHSHHSVNLMLFSGSMALVQTLFAKTLHVRYGLFKSASIGAFLMIISFVSIPLLGALCKAYLMNHSKWLHVLLHSYISVFAGAGYGIVLATGATVFSDFAKKLTNRHADKWLAAWSCSSSIGCLIVVPQTIIAEKIGVPKTIMFLTIPSAIVLFALLVYLYFATTDIAVVVDVHKAVANSKAVTVRAVGADVEAGDRAVQRMGSLDRASRDSINAFMFGVNGIVTPAMLLGIPTTEAEPKAGDRKDLSKIVPMSPDLSVVNE